MKQSTKFGLKLAGVIGAATYAGTLLGGLAAYQVAMHVSDAQKQQGRERSRAENTEIENFWYFKQPKQQWMIQSFDGLNERHRTNCVRCVSQTIAGATRV
ncbi:hypothetical protein WP50_20345 [Lactiplantibacillus plantarum]|nr:hypothetical protein WP50_20345 [Lactiplantibacillus plantarum]